jgi:glycine cleavage system protein P-like pyridoxal-binding family
MALQSHELCDERCNTQPTMLRELACCCTEMSIMHAQVCGAMTSGGSESNIAAVLASIAYMKATKGITQPEIIIPETAHASFWKAAKLCRAKCDPFQMQTHCFISTPTHRSTPVYIFRFLMLHTQDASFFVFSLFPAPD